MFRLGLAEQIIALVDLAILLLLPMIFFSLTVQRAISRCAPQSRTMSPGKAWLMLIPLFNMGWSFILVGRVASSLANEFSLRKIAAPQVAPGKSIGLAWAILWVFSLIPLFYVFFGIAGLICWIVYWVKISNYSAKIAPATNRPATVDPDGYS
jgi:hypothetical protein